MQEHHEKEEDDEHTPDQIHLMQTQDVKYVSMKKTIEANKIKRMQSELHMIDLANEIPFKQTFFVDSDEEDVDLATRLDTHPALLNRRTNRPRIKDLQKISLSEADIKVSSTNIQYHINTNLNIILKKKYFRLQKNCTKNGTNLTMN